jgi:hypothetical protein
MCILGTEQGGRGKSTLNACSLLLIPDDELENQNMLTVRSSVIIIKVLITKTFTCYGVINSL